MPPPRRQPLQLLKRTPDHLVIGMFTIPGQICLLRVVAGLLGLGLGLRWWSQSPWLSLLVIGIAAVILFPADGGQILSLDKGADQLTLKQYRYWIPQILVQMSLSEIEKVNVVREAVRREVESVTVYRCDVVVTLNSGESQTLGSYQAENRRGSISDPRELAEMMHKWIQRFLKQ
ncbi:MAG: hypothetical protein HC921_08220 [Synechococcaceae cyanobacterium SM2_3_1]|nr:hypothetical protein [Synechococcaceae cyanobacterium SM2_3_1]